MFLIRRPSLEVIRRFLRHSRDLPLSYSPAGLVRAETYTRGVGEWTNRIGHGEEDFERAKAALLAWKQLDVGWLRPYPRDASATAGTEVAILIRHFGFWSLNGCRVLYRVGSPEQRRFGYAYGTLTNHAESGEELFEVFMDPVTGDVMYRIRAVSWPRAALAHLGQPIVRSLQARFRTHSAAAMERATRSGDRHGS